MKRKQILPLALVFCLFFLWAISSNLLPTMIRQLMKTCELNAFEASFTETAYWLAYFICPIPIAMFMKRYSYKSGIVFGLVLAAAGGLLFFPAAIIKEYWAYLGIFFISIVAQRPVGIIQGEGGLGKTHGRTLLGAAEDHVFHLSAAEGLGALLAHDPEDRVGNIGFTGAVGADDGSDIVTETDQSFVRKGLKTLHFQTF